jgi:hypothetical protein
MFKDLKMHFLDKFESKLVLIIQKTAALLIYYTFRLMQLIRRDPLLYNFSFFITMIVSAFE